MNFSLSPESLRLFESVKGMAKDNNPGDLPRPAGFDREVRVFFSFSFCKSSQVRTLHTNCTQIQDSSLARVLASRKGSRNYYTCATL